MTRLSVICAFDAGFLPGFAPLVASLRRHSPILGAADRIVITTDPAVLDAPEVRRLAARVRLITEAEIAGFRSVQRDKIRPHLVGREFPKTSMMKWFAYDDYGYDAALVMDTDIVNTRNADGMLAFLRSADVVGSPLFPRQLRRKRGKALPHAVAARQIARFVAGKDDWARKLNSGVLLFNRKMMSAQVRAELIEVATEEAAPNEQVVLRRWIRRGDVRVRLLTPNFNFNASFLASAEPDGPGALFPKVRFLHYVGPLKPWSVPDDARTWAHDLWRDYRRAAALEADRAS